MGRRSRAIAQALTGGVQARLLSISTDPNAYMRSKTTDEVSTNGGATWTTTRITNFTYYSAGDAQGDKGDLESDIVTDADGNLLDSQYFTYYTSSSDIGYDHGLKMEFGSDSYARLTAAGLTLASSDADLLPYADQYFQYDSQQRITEHIVQGEGCSACTGGAGTYTYAYSTGSVSNPDPTDDPNAYNVWTNKTVETLPDGNTNTLYTNQYGMTILTVFTDIGAGQAWSTFTKYAGTGADAGEAVLTAQPTAVTGYSESAADLVTLNDSGLINLTDYYSSTTATSSVPGGVAGEVEDTKIEDGSSGTPILQSSMDYFLRTGTDVTIYPVADSVVYRNTDGTGAQTTSYSYTWQGSTDQMAA